MKYIEVDRLRAEIENRIDELNPKVGMFGDKPLRSVNPKTFPRESELENVLDIITSLQQEQPESSESLDEAAALSANGAVISRQSSIDGRVVYNLNLKCFNYEDLVRQFKKGAEWMATQWKTIDGEITTTSDNGWEIIRIPKKLYPLGTKVMVQIRKK